MEQTNTTTGTPQRPQFLTVLCILSYIGGALWALGSLIGIFAAEWISSLMGMGLKAGLDATNDGLDEASRQSLNEAMGAAEQMGSTSGMIYFVVSTLLAIISIVGVAQMWKLKKSGFMVYTGANVVQLILSAVLMTFSIMSTIITIAFIGMYAANRKALVH